MIARLLTTTSRLATSSRRTTSARRWAAVQPTPSNNRCAIAAQGHARRGYSLVECLIVISILFVVMSLSLTLIRTLLRAEANLSERAGDTNSRMRLLRRWQADLNAAVSARVQNNADGTTELQVLQPGDRQVVYRLNGSRLFREVKNGSDPKIVARDNYYLGNDTVARFERASQGVTMSWYIVIGKSIQRWQHPDDVSSRDINDRAVEVRLGAGLARWRRFATVPVTRVTDAASPASESATTTTPSANESPGQPPGDAATGGSSANNYDPAPPSVDGPTEVTP